MLMTPLLLHPNFGGVPLGQDRPCCGQLASRNLKLFGREIIFEVFQPERHRRTDGRTDSGITALCVASRGNDKNSYLFSLLVAEGTFYSVAETHPIRLSVCAKRTSPAATTLRHAVPFLLMP